MSKNHLKELSGYWPLGLGSGVPILRCSPLIGAHVIFDLGRKAESVSLL